MDPVNHQVSPRIVELESSVPDEIILRIFSLLSLEELGMCARVCKQWHQVAYDDSLRFTIYSELNKAHRLIGPETLNRCFGKVDEVPPLTDEILNDLKSPDPENKEKMNKDTHILALIPKITDDTPLSLDSLQDLAINPKDGKNPSQYLTYWKEIKKAYGKNPYPKTSWVLMTEDVLKGSKGLRRTDQLRMASEHGEGFRAPTLLEAAYVISTLFMDKRKTLLGRNAMTSTCCLDMPLKRRKLTVSGHNLIGIYINRCVDDSPYAGVLALKKY